MTPQKFEQFYRDNYKRYIHTINRLCGYDWHRAEDIVQQSFENMYRVLDQYDEKRGTVKTWFNIILYNTFRKDCRDTKQTQALVDEIWVGEVPNSFIEEYIEKVEKEEHRLILILHILRGYTSPEIESLFGGKFKEENVRQVTSRFKKSLKMQYESSFRY